MTFLHTKINGLGTIIFPLFLLLVMGNFANLPAQESDDLNELIDEAFLARADKSGEPTDITNEFFTTDIPIYCIVMLKTIKPTLVKMELFTQKVPGFKSNYLVIKTSYTTKEGQNRVTFTGRPDGVWKAGTYRINISINGDLKKSIDFSVKAKSIEITQKARRKPSAKKN